MHSILKFFSTCLLIRRTVVRCHKCDASNASFMSLWYLFYQSKSQLHSEVKCCTTFSSQERYKLRDFHVSENMQLRTSMSKKLKGSQRMCSHVRSTSAIIARSAITRTTVCLSVYLLCTHLSYPRAGCTREIRWTWEGRRRRPHGPYSSCSPAMTQSELR